MCPAPQGEGAPSPLTSPHSLSNPLLVLMPPEPHVAPCKTASSDAKVSGHRTCWEWIDHIKAKEGREGETSTWFSAEGAPRPLTQHVCTTTATAWEPQLQPLPRPAHRTQDKKDQAQAPTRSASGPRENSPARTSPRTPGQRGATWTPKVCTGKGTADSMCHMPASRAAEQQCPIPSQG